MMILVFELIWCRGGESTLNPFWQLTIGNKPAHKKKTAFQDHLQMLDLAFKANVVVGSSSH